jgi:hypothetical protein
LYKQEFEFDSPFSTHGLSVQEVLQRRSQDTRNALEQGIRRVIDRRASEGAYIDSVISKFSVRIPHFDFENIKKTEAYEEKPGSFFTGEVIFTNQAYKAWVVTFGFPYKGEIEFLRYIPRTGTGLNTPLFTFDRQYMYFTAWTLDKPDKDVQKIKAEKDNAIAFLQKRVADVKPELEQFNRALPSDVRAVFKSLKQKYLKDKDMLDQL